MADPVRTLLIVPPFASIHWPAHGIHVLQSVAREQGLQADVLYANLMFAALLGEEEYEATQAKRFAQHHSSPLHRYFRV